MQLKTNEIGGIIAALNEKDGSPRKYQTIELPDVYGILKKIKEITKDGNFIPEGEFELEFNTSEKKFILDKIDDREWMAADAEVILNLKEKLEK